MTARGKREAPKARNMTARGKARSAEGAEYDSQGQARSASPLVTMNGFEVSTESAKYQRKVKYENRSYWRQWAHRLKGGDDTQQAWSRSCARVTRNGRKHAYGRRTNRRSLRRISRCRRVEFTVVRGRTSDGIFHDFN